MSGAGPNEEAGAPAGVGRKAAAGAAWLLGDTVFGKLGSVATQLVLARLLVPDDFGVFALAFTVVSIAELASRSGLRDITIKRGDDFARVGPTAFWMAVVFGLVSAAAIAAVSGAAAVWYDSARVEQVLLVAAIAPALNGLCVVPRARLETGFRYRAITLVGWAVVLVRSVVSIGLAAAGMGVFALVWGVVIASATKAGLLLALSPPPLGSPPRVSVARELLSDSVLLFGAGLMAAIVAQGDYVVLGLFVEKSDVGVYFVAYTVSAQILFMFGQSAGSVLMPSLSLFGADDRRRGAAFLEASRLLLLSVGSLCGFLAVCGDAVVELLYPDAYLGAGVLVSVLAAGMFFRLLSVSSAAMLKASGMFRAHLASQAVLGVCTIALVAVGCWSAGVVGCAVAVAAASVLYGLGLPVLALRRSGFGFREVLECVVPPMVIALAAAASVVALRAAARDAVPLAAELGAAFAAYFAVYLVVAYLVVPHWIDAAGRRTDALWRRVPIVRNAVAAFVGLCRSRSARRALS